MRMIVMKIQYFHGHTGIWPEPESESFHMRYIHETSKAFYYVFEYKYSRVIRIKKLVLGPCLSYKILRIFLLKQQYRVLDPRTQNTNFYRGNPLDSP